MGRRLQGMELPAQHARCLSALRCSALYYCTLLQVAQGQQVQWLVTHRLKAAAAPQGPNNMQQGGPMHNGCAPDSWKGSSWRGPFTGPGSAGAGPTALRLPMLCGEHGREVDAASQPAQGSKGRSARQALAEIWPAASAAAWSMGRAMAAHRRTSGRRMGRASSGQPVDRPGHGAAAPAAGAEARMPAKARCREAHHAPCTWAPAAAVAHLLTCSLPTLPCGAAAPGCHACLQSCQLTAGMSTLC